MSASPPARRRAGGSHGVSSGGRRRTPSRSHSRGRNHQRRHKHGGAGGRSVKHHHHSPLPVTISNGHRSPLSAVLNAPNTRSRSLSRSHRRDQSSPPRRASPDPYRERRRPPSPYAPAPAATAPRSRGFEDERPPFPRYPATHPHDRFVERRPPTIPPAERFYDRGAALAPPMERGDPRARDFDQPPPLHDREPFVVRRDVPPPSQDRDRRFSRDTGRDFMRERESLDAGRPARGFDRDFPRNPVESLRPRRSVEKDRDVDMDRERHNFPTRVERREFRSSRSREREREIDLEREKLGFPSRSDISRDSRDARDRGGRRDRELPNDADSRDPKRLKVDDEDRRFSVYVARLPGDYEDRDLREFFRECGEIKSLVVIEKDPGKKYAFVNFKDEETRRRAIELNGRPVHGVPIVVEIPSEGRRRR